MWGVAGGLVAYRYAVLPLLWQSPMRHVVPALALALVFGGRPLVARRDGAVGSLVIAGVAGAALAFGLCFAAFPTLSRAKLETRTFPGFSIGLPSGETVDDQTASYAMGKLSMKGIAGSRSVLILQWELGGEMTAEDMKLVARVMSSAMPDLAGEPRITTVPGPDGKPVQSIVFDGDRGVFELSALVCGARHLLVATGGERAALALHERIVASFQCKPDPEREAKAAVFSFPVDLDLPGWYATARDPEAFEITDGKSATLTLRSLPPGLNLPLERMLEPIFQASGLTEGLEVGAKLPDGRVPYKLTIEGETTVGWAALVSCPTATGLVIAVAWDHTISDAVYDKVEAAKCRAPHAPGQTWPDPPAGADAPAP